MLAQHKPFMRSLRRSHTSSPSSSSPSNSSPFSSAAAASSSSSWIHLRSVLLVVGSSSSSASTNRGTIKSPWSRRRRKHALLPKQWERLFDKDGRISDGGVKFLKKIRSGGVDPSLRAEVWPFLLGVYDLNSSKEERDSIKTENRKEYENLRRLCRKFVKRSNKSIKSIETCENNSNENSGEFSRVLDSPVLDDNIIPHGFFDSPTPGYHVSIQSPATSAGTDADLASEAADTDSSDSVSSQESDTVQVAAEDFDEHPRPRSPTAEDYATWQRIIRLDAIRANADWVIYSPSQASVSQIKAERLAESVCLKDYNHLDPCRIFHAARLVSILEAYALYDAEIGYCQGMTDLLSPIISVIDDDVIAFWCFVNFMRKARHNFRLDEVGIQRQLNIVSKIIKGKDCILYRHLEKFQAEDCFFVYRMVVVLFRRELNFEQTLCLWEVMWADQAAIRAGIARTAWGKMRLRAPPTDDLLLYAIAACVLQRRKLIIEKYSSTDEILRECNSMAGSLDVWKLLDDAHDLVVTLHDKI